MMPDCKLEPDDKRAFGRAVGNDLLKHHGKQKYYTPQQVKASCDRLGYPVDWHCWAMSLFTSPEAFAIYHEALGEVCDRVVMRSDMITALSESTSWSIADVDLSWLDWPDIDLSGIFEGFDWS